MYRRRRTLLVKHEDTPGTPEALADADGAINVFDLEINPEVAFEERDGQGGFSPLPQAAGARMGRCTFRTQLIGGATIPFWAARLLPACGWVEASRVFKHVSAHPGVSGVKSVTIGAYIDGVKKSLCGAMGNPVFEFVSGRVVNIRWTFIGKWITPVAGALPAPTFPADVPGLLKFANAGLAVGSWSPRLANLSLDLGGGLIMVEDANHSDGTGYAHASISSRRINGRMDPELPLVATYDLFADWIGMEQKTFGFQLGSGDNGIKFTAPKLQWIAPTEGERNQLQIEQLDYQLCRDAAEGDELEIEFTEQA